MLQVDINSDLGEGFGAYKIGMDAQVLACISSANVACGFHAGDALVMERTVKLAKERGTAVGAHPGFPDLQGFGRRPMQVTEEEAKAYMKYQIGALQAFTAAAGVPLQHVKPHGALYNMAGVDPKLAMAICRGVAEVDPALILLGGSGSCLLQAAKECGLLTASEVFADRAYEEDGTLVSRGKPGAILHDESYAIRRVVRMVKEGVVESITGKVIPIHAQSICIHGDNPEALRYATKIRESLEAEGICITPLSALVG